VGKFFRRGDGDGEPKPDGEFPVAIPTYYSGRRKEVSPLSFSSNPKQSKEPSAFTLVKALKAESKGKAT
jgi:hypothetical protein